MCVSLCAFPILVVFCILNRCKTNKKKPKKLCSVLQELCWRISISAKYIVFVGLVLLLRARSPKLEIVVPWT